MWELQGLVALYELIERRTNRSISSRDDACDVRTPEEPRVPSEAATNA